MMIVEREKWRARCPSRCEEVVGLVVVAVLNVVRAEAWEKRREEDSVAVLSMTRGVAYMRTTTTGEKETIGGGAELGLLTS